MANNVLSLKQRIESRRRVLEESGPAVTPTAAADEPYNVIYVKPDAIFGIVLSLFISFISYVGFMCLYGTKIPKSFASKPFKFGKEM